MILKKTIKLVFQAIFLALFVFLIANGKIQLWMGLFVLSVLAIFLLGRVYCGWICPINSVMRGITWIKKKLHIKSVRIPAWLIKPWIRILVLGLFISVFIFTMVTGKKLPVLLILFAAGVALTFFFSEKLWHRYLCPYGTIMSIPAQKSKYAMTIAPGLCNSCGMCMRVCPAKAVKKHEGYYEILKRDCLVCMECSRVCKQKAISYDK